jgi:mannose-6-phosphate isomerase
MKLAPLLFEPKLVPKVWGGRQLEGYGKALPAQGGIGESWDIYDRPGDSALVAQGPWKGRSLHELMLESGPALLGQAGPGPLAGAFPLMVKLIDARESLSLQVHPDDAQALALGGPGQSGKTEMWVVLEAAPGATSCAGLRSGVTAAQLKGALASGHWEGIFHEFPVKQGDAIFIPAGRLHAIGKGCLVAEIQQNSDLTYRVYDYARLEQGKPRELHLEQALACIRFDAAMAGMPALVSPRRLSASEESLVECPYFKVSRLTLRSAFRPPSSPKSFHLLTALGDPIRIKAQEGETLLSKGATALLPASLAWSLEPLGGDCRALWSRP